MEERDHLLMSRKQVDVTEIGCKMMVQIQLEGGVTFRYRLGKGKVTTREIFL